jgi:hypothetical protein
MPERNARKATLPDSRSFFPTQRAFLDDYRRRLSAIAPELMRLFRFLQRAKLDLENRENNIARFCRENLRIDSFFSALRTSDSSECASDADE